MWLIVLNPSCITNLSNIAVLSRVFVLSLHQLYRLCNQPAAFNGISTRTVQKRNIKNSMVYVLIHIFSYRYKNLKGDVLIRDKTKIKN